MIFNGGKGHNKIVDCLIWRDCKCWYQMKQMGDEKWNQETSNETSCKNMQTKYSGQCSLDMYVGINERNL